MAGLGVFSLLLGFTGISAPAQGAQPAQAPAPSATATPPAKVPPGFAPPDRTGFAPILKFAPPGPNRAERAMSLVDRQIDFQRKALHPELSPQLDALIDKIPPRQSTLIRAASYYSRTDIPWVKLPDGTHQLCVEGYPSGNDMYLAVAAKCQKPDQPFRVSGHFALKPGVEPQASLPAVIGAFGGELETNTFGLGALVDAAAAILTETYGDLRPPWDTAAGQYNHHDVASRQRFRRDLPSLDDKLVQYLKFNNVLDEFDGPGGPWVLFNFNGEVKTDSLRKYENLYGFYRRIALIVRAEVDVMDGKGDYWFRGGLDRGKIWLTFMVRGGKLSAFGADYRPAGEPIAFDRFEHGVNRTHSWIHVTHLGMDFGLDNLSFTNYYTRGPNDVTFDTRMDAVPRVVAPIGLRQAAQLVAGEFMETVAQGAGGMHTQLTSHDGNGTVHFASEITAEFRYSPTLEFLARIGDSIAEANNDKVRADERRLGEELLDAFVKDYNNARPRILALDQDPELTR